MNLQRDPSIENSGCNATFELEESTYARLIVLAETQGKALDELLQECVRQGLPHLERDIPGEQFVGKSWWKNEFCIR